MTLITLIFYLLVGELGSGFEGGGGGGDDGFTWDVVVVLNPPLLADSLGR